MHAGSDGWGALKEWDCHAHLIPLARRTDTALNRAAPDKGQSAFLSSMNLHLSPSERISELSRLVNTMEKIAPPEFSIRIFGSVYASRSQIISLRTDASCLLTRSVFPAL